MAKQQKRYSKVSMELWGDDKFAALSPLKPSGQGLWLYLLLSPYRSIIPGLTLNVGLGTIADRLSTWGTSSVRKHWREIEAQGMAAADWSAGVIWLPRAIVHNEPESPNVIRSWGKVPLPRCGLVLVALERLRRYIDVELGDAYVEAFDETLGASFEVPLTQGVPPPLPQGVPEGLPSSFGESGALARARARGTPPLPPASRGVEISRKPPTREERKWANEFYRLRSQTRQPRCPHTPECEFDIVCLGRVIQDKRWAEAHGQEISLKEIA